MLGMFNIFPLLKGWQYKDHRLEKAVMRGGASDPWRIPDVGWLVSIGCVTTDAYGAMRIEYQDADLQLHTIEASPEAMRLVGTVQQDPAGWLQRYFRPNPYSTAGAYVMTLFSGGNQGAAWPFIPTTTIRLLLGEDSTQANATVGAISFVVSITNRVLFAQSLRQLLDSYSDIDIPKELLEFGPADLKQQPNKTIELLEDILAELKRRK